jgi:hypothetical protein
VAILVKIYTRKAKKWKKTCQKKIIAKHVKIVLDYCWLGTLMDPVNWAWFQNPN